MLHKIMRFYGWNEENGAVNVNASQNGNGCSKAVCDSAELLLRYHHALRLGALLLMAHCSGLFLF